MKGYVVRKGDRYYAVIYEGIDPITGRERRRTARRLQLAVANFRTARRSCAARDLTTQICRDSPPALVPPIAQRRPTRRRSTRG
ncbi:MAG: hypothetical protein ABIO83_04880, partial [Ilumatobacteraceae bacterium]